MFYNTILFTSGTARDEIYFEQQFIVTGGIDCRLRSTIYTRISERNILTWIQEVTGNIIYIDCIYHYYWIYISLYCTIYSVIKWLTYFMYGLPDL